MCGFLKIIITVVVLSHIKFIQDFLLLYTIAAWRTLVDPDKIPAVSVALDYT